MSTLGWVHLTFGIVALLALGIWGWQQSDGWPRFVLALAIPLVAAAVWGTFNVPQDPSRSGAAPVAVTGILRLAIELTLFLSAIWALYATGYTSAGLVLGIIVAVHYVASYDRIHWLLAH